MRIYESETVELKEIYTPDLKKEVVAIANTNGCIIYISARNSGEILGLDNVNFVMQQISNAIRESIRPDISMFTSIELVQKEDMSIIKITINQGTKKPYYLSDKGLKLSGVHIRSGTISAPVSEDAIRRMIKMTVGDYVFGLKLVSWFGDNTKQGLPAITGLTMIFDLVHGFPKGILNASYMTGMRTGAAGALGIKYLARSNSSVLSVVGTGRMD